MSHPNAARKAPRRGSATDHLTDSERFRLGLEVDGDPERLEEVAKMWLAAEADILAREA